MTFDEWLQQGVNSGFCTQQFCQTHDMTPMTDYEEGELEDGGDPCVHVVRLGSPNEWAN